MMKTATLFLAAVALVASGTARADDLRGVVFAGGSISDSQSGYGGAVVALPGARLGDGLALRASGVVGHYSYDAATGKIDGDYAGGELALVYQTSGRWGWANFSAGPRLTDTRLTPRDPGNHRDGTRLDVGLQSDGALDGKQWRASWFASLGPLDGAYALRGQLGRKAGSAGTRLGLEAGVWGDPRFTQTSTGAFAAASVKGGFEVQLGAGAKFQHGHRTRPYIALGLSKVF